MTVACGIDADADAVEGRGDGHERPPETRRRGDTAIRRVSCEEGVSLLRRILGKVILVMSGRGRMMYQCLEPKPEGAIFSKRSKPQGTDSSPHDTATSMANWLESNIQGDGFVRFLGGETKGTRRCWWRSPDDRNWR